MKKVSNNKSFVRSNLVRYKLHDTNLIPKQFIKKQRTSSHVITTSQLLDLSLFVSVSTLFLRASSSVGQTNVLWAGPRSIN